MHIMNAITYADVCVRECKQLINMIMYLHICVRVYVCVPRHLLCVRWRTCVYAGEHVRVWYVRLCGTSFWFRSDSQVVIKLICNPKK